jgi:hypothetical protein
MWDPQHLTTLYASKACHRDSFTSTSYSISLRYHPGICWDQGRQLITSAGFPDKILTRHLSNSSEALLLQPTCSAPLILQSMRYSWNNATRQWNILHPPPVAGTFFTGITTLCEFWPPCQNPDLDGHELHFIWPLHFVTWVALPRTYASAGIALGVTGARQPLCYFILGCY